ncbi:hypothetical protein [Clostridium thermobutyricum]|uniref:Uncharacterized protein n=1 Tax=Clostridium thermobutyricum DSM 4928 TaxID=1121339 RepID=A0A1V4SV53_9CLOT|nr:hypothetical protein [Clostridium thermobutyricum]OPX47181.1 hypothetical protein CLTHE_21260 [Clostridium thermobutyricum DSM 4928]
MKNFFKNTFVLNILLLILGITWWIIYIYDLNMSTYGLYPIFSYNVHEILSITPLLFISITFIWTLYLIRKSFVEKTIKSNKLFCMIFIILFILQINFIINLNNTLTTTLCTSIDEINVDTMQVIIHTNEDTLTLNCPVMVLDLLKTDGTKYNIMYKSTNHQPNYGVLCSIQYIN